MDIFAWGVVVILLAYVLTYSYKFLLPMFRYKRQRNFGIMKEYKGRVTSLSDEQKKKFNGEIILISMPVYGYIVDGEEKSLQSYIKYRNAKIGDEVTITCNERTGDAWNLKELPMMKKQLIARTAIIYLLLIAFTLINLFG